MSARHLRLAVVGLAAVSAALLAGCSSSSKSAPTPAAGPGGAATAVAAGSSPDAAGSGVSGAAASASSALGLSKGGPLDVSKLCAAVPAADAQKLFKGAAGPVTDNPGECDWGGGGVTVDIYTNDTSKQYYNGGAVDNGTPIRGIGDVAQWSAPVPSASVPDLAAQQGSLTVTVTIGLDVDQTSMTYTGSSPFYKIDPAVTAQYVTEEGQICKDIFRAAG